jgi:hypothetical protein
LYYLSASGSYELSLAASFHVRAHGGATGGLVIGTLADAPIILHTGGAANANERMRITGTGQKTRLEWLLLCVLVTSQPQIRPIYLHNSTPLHSTPLATLAGVGIGSIFSGGPHNPAAMLHIKANVNTDANQLRIFNPSPGEYRERERERERDIDSSGLHIDIDMSIQIPCGTAYTVTKCLVQSED